MLTPVLSGQVFRGRGYLIRVHRVRPAGVRLLVWTARRGCRAADCPVGRRTRLPGVCAALTVRAVYPHGRPDAGGWWWAAAGLTAAPARVLVNRLP